MVENECVYQFFVHVQFHHLKRSGALRKRALPWHEYTDHNHINNIFSTSFPFILTISIIYLIGKGVLVFGSCVFLLQSLISSFTLRHLICF